MKVDLFIPCFIDQLYPETALNTLKVLKKLGVDVSYNTEQTCCGQPSFNGGYWKQAAKLARKFIQEFDKGRPIVSPSASCTGFIRNYYPELLKDSIYINDFKKIKSQIFEITDFIVNQLEITDLGASFPAKVCYHDACSALREYGIKNEPRELLKNVQGLELVEMKDSDTCCGFGGTFSVKHEAISTAMAEQKVNNALDTGAEYLVSTEASCLMHLESYIKKKKLPIKTIHIIDILAAF